MLDLNLVTWSVMYPNCSTSFHFTLDTQIHALGKLVSRTDTWGSLKVFHFPTYDGPQIVGTHLNCVRIHKMHLKYFSSN